MSQKNAIVLDSDARLTVYAIAAAASAAMVSSASATIIYSGPQNISIPSSQSQSIDLDLNGIDDIKLENYVFGNGPYQGVAVNFNPGQVVGFVSGFYVYAKNMTVGDIVGPASVGPSFTGVMAYGANEPNAQFQNVTDGLVGFSFPSVANTDFGWVRVDVDDANSTFVIKDWAFDDSGAPIGAGIVPEPASLGLLALGAAGLACYRGQRKSSIISSQ